MVTTVAGMGDGLGRPSSHTSASVAQSQQHTVVDQPTTPHGGRAGVGRGSAFNPDNQGSESYTCPEINAIIEESNTKFKSPMSQTVLTELDMQFNDIDSVCHKKGNGENVHVISSESLITPRRTELIGEKVGEFNESNNSNTDCGQLNDPHAPRKWKRIEREPHVHSQPSNLQNSSGRKEHVGMKKQSCLSYKTKKSMFRRRKSRKFQWWRLQGSPAKNNKSNSVELS